ncbi:MAG: NAD(P)-dependent oxidoreductase [Anaerolineaceae bacterium]|nr:NAD(P)-dependent oxidoreductase [Anaerolineaceae bacterium]
MKTKRIGLIGLGEMGMGMARNLLAAGFPLTGLDLRAERRAMLEQAGGAVAGSPADLGRAADVAILMLFSGAQVPGVLQGEDGLLAGMQPGGTVIVCATVGPGVMRDVATLLESKGLRWLDCPVSGGRQVAEAGALGLFVAGSAGDVAAQRDVLAAIGERVIYVGEEPGLGQALKAATLGFYGVASVGLMEALALGARAGVPLEALREAFCADGRQSHFQELAGYALEGRFSGSDNQIRYTVKDLEICLELGRECEVSLPATRASHEQLSLAHARYPDEDKQSLLKLLKTRPPI